MSATVVMEEECDSVTSFIDRILGVNDVNNMSLTYAISADEMMSMVRKCQEVVRKQPVMIELNPGVKICGDQLEVISVLVGFKVAMPESFFLLRGNHECSAINRTYGFYDECNRRYKTARLYDAFQDFFNYLPLCALVGGRIFCMHGGISPLLTSWDQLEDSKVTRPLEPSSRSLASDLLWSDPDSHVAGWAKNGRGVSVTFGEDVVREFCRKMDIDLIVRGHQVVQDGYEFFAERHLVTIFSAPRYCGEFDNSAAVMCVSSKMEVSFEVIKARVLPPKFVSKKKK